MNCCSDREKHFASQNSSQKVRTSFITKNISYLLFFFSFTDKRKGMLKNTSTNKCLMPDGSNSSANVLLADCDVNDQRLLWTFDYDEKSKDSILKL